ncbi:MAG: hypothetical protein ACXWFZ_11055 [Nitrososphaeraceae archaeon]
MINISPQNVTFNPGDAVDINVQRSLGSIGDYYEGDEKLPIDLVNEYINEGINNKVIDLNEEHVAAAAAANNVNVQQTLSNLGQLNADYMKSPFELTGGNNQILNLNEENDNDNEDENDKDNEED